MQPNKTCIYNAKIVLPDSVIMGSVLIEGSSIVEVLEDSAIPECAEENTHYIDAEGACVMPGMIDIHSDAIEKEIQPRPNTLFPVKMAFYELEKKLAGNGITTIYHSLSLSDEWGVRDSDTVVGIIDSINRFNQARSMIDHKIHLRYELTYFEGLEILEKLIENKSIDFMSYMDHTPGQGQFKDPEELKQFTMQSYGKKEEDVNEFIDRTIQYQSQIDWSRLITIAVIARNKGIRLASHDDDTKSKVDTLMMCNGVLSEFPINAETAEYAIRQGLHVCVGAPNIVRGKSHSNNMRAMDAIKINAANIICSDYLPSAMLPAVFKVHQEGVALHQAVSMVTYQPAKAVGIDKTVGSIEAGKLANLLVVEMHEDYPVVRKTFSEGKLIYQSDFKTNKDMDKNRSVGAYADQRSC